MRMKPAVLFLLAALVPVAACKRQDEPVLPPPIVEPSPSSSPSPPFSSSLRPVAYESLRSTPDLYAALASYHFPSTRTVGDFTFSLDAAVDVPARTARFTLTVNYDGTDPFDNKITLHYILCGAEGERNSWNAACFFPRTSAVLEPPFQPAETRTVQASVQNSQIGGSFRYYVPYASIRLPDHVPPVEVGILLGP